MNYYPFNIGDYLSHTAHLDELEDLAFRRMLDYCYLHERHLPDNVEDIAKAIRMRTHCECITNVLREFFILEDDGYINKRIASEINSFQEKSKKASESAKARWDKNRNKNKPLPSKKGDDANALRTECEGNAIQETRNTKQETIIKDKSRFQKPSKDDVYNYMFDKEGVIVATAEAERFYNYYESNGWKVGKNKMKDWKAAVNGWLSRSKQYENPTRNESNGSKPRKSAAERTLENIQREFGQGSIS